MDPVARARAIAARLAATAIPSDALGKRKSRWEDDADGGAARPAPGFVEKKRKKVYIPVDKYPDINFMGLLIGPRGSNQKRMEDESGAKILIRGKGSSKDPTGDPDENEELHVLITADTDEAIAKAQSAVEDILFNPQQAMKLKQEQLRKVAELNGTLNENYGNRDGGEPSGHYGPSGSADGGEKDATTEMQVPRDLVGYIIGRGGETIRDLQMKSGAHIQIVREEEGAQGTPHRFVSISGTEEALQKAQTMIQNLVDERTNGSGPRSGSGSGGGFRERDDNDRMARYGGVNPDGSESMELHIPNERVGLIIGRAGATIKSIQQRTGSSVTIPQTPDPNNPSMRLITIRGTIQAKEAAKQEILAIINDDHGGRGGHGGHGGSTIYMQVPNDRVGVVIGKRGETIRGIQDRHGVRIQIPQVPDPGSNPSVRTISIEGPVNSLQPAKEEVDMVILQGAGGHGGGYGGQSHYGGSNHYGGGSYDQQQYGQQQQQQYGYGQAQGQAAQGQYDTYYQQQYYQQAVADPNAAAVAADPAAAAATADPNAAAAATTTADPNDPNAYWNGYYEYAAYYGVDAANAAWGVTGAAAQASAEAYAQWQAAGGAAATAEGAADPAAGATATGDASQAQAPPGTA
uniref:K Homology domain-containing protein n=1 Tax=Globisporangium ultimum (strain ATCC 200006 / CBS 805.95 / DAOM BR144) TaxID=431595 RepID=K3X5D6_GLOUD